MTCETCDADAVKGGRCVRCYNRRYQRERRHADPTYRARTNEINRASFRRMRSDPARLARARATWRRAAAKRRVRRHAVALLIVQGGRCPLCMERIEDLADAHVDHIVPRAKGGGDEWENVQLVHAPCNLRKLAKTGLRDRRDLARRDSC